MSGALQLGRLFGISIRVHFSWLFIFFLIAWSLATSILPRQYPGWNTNTYWVLGVIGSAVLFLSVLLHELSHSLLAASRGHHVKGITLFFLGGVSEIEAESNTPGEEFWIALVGPLTSFALSGIFWLLSRTVASGSEHIQAVTGYLAVVNLSLGIFNLLPAFPLDGGRVLKAIVWRATGSLPRALTVASISGSAIGFSLIGIGVFLVFTGNMLSGLWMAFIGWFIQSSASSGRQEQVVHTALSGKLVRDAMRGDFPSVGPGVTVQQLVDDHITKEFQRAYVVALGDSFQGLVTVSDVQRVPPEERTGKWVTEVMTRAADVVAVSPDDPLEVALQKLISGDMNQLVVMDNGKAVGLLTRGDVLRVLEIAQLLRV